MLIDGIVVGWGASGENSDGGAHRWWYQHPQPPPAEGESVGVKIFSSYYAISR